MRTFKSLQLFLLVSILFLCYSCKTDIIAYYPFNGNANDLSGNRKHGEVYGAKLSRDRHLKQNSSYYFNGKTSYIEIKNFGEIIKTDEITVSMWAKSLSSRAQFQLMLCPDDNRFAISINYYHAGINTIFWDYGWQGEGGDAPGRLYFRPEPVDTLWHHYVFVSSTVTKNMKIYKDKELLIQKSEPRELLNTKDRNLFIGSGDKAHFFIGYLDEIKIYNRILSAAEIERLYNH
jgi:hypothetical protein